MKEIIKKFPTNPIRGMKDFYPSDLREVNFILTIVEEIADLYCYEEIEAPLLEPIEIFAAKSSNELVNEQSFIVEKKKGEKLILMPELTPSLARMIAKKSQEIKKPIRWFSNPTCYRYERPQKGRRRSFKQINFDILGQNNLYAELEIFNIVIDILTSFGATNDQFQIYYNNRRFIDVICEYILNVSRDQMPLVYKILDKSDKMEEKEFEKYVIDSFQNEFIVQGILKLKDANTIEKLLQKFDDIPEKLYDAIGYKELVNLESLIKEAGLSDYCSFSSSVVRGLDYYTGIVFEVYDTGMENRRAIFGGGRYDDLLSLFSDEPLSGIGFGMGVLMLTLFLKTYDLIPEDLLEKDYSDTIYIASINDKVAPYAIEIARIVREESFPCIVDYRFKNLKNQLSKANELGVQISLIIGPKEMEQRKITVKNMSTEEQKTINLEDIIEEIYEVFDELEEL
ncbi:MAG: histidine--tRNA ligase [Promethearchaeota archaeon]